MVLSGLLKRYALLAMVALSTGVQASFDWSSGTPGMELATANLVKRDLSGNPATRAYQNCALRFRNKISLPDVNITCNPGVQAGECYVNARVHHEDFATFEPDDGDDFLAHREGGAYGTCCGYSKFAKSNDLIETSNPNYWCFIWEGKGKEPAPGEEAPKDGFPGMVAIPYPLICPHNLQNCYSKDYFKNGFKMEGWADTVPNATGFWYPPKGKDIIPPFARNNDPVPLWCCEWVLKCLN